MTELAKTVASSDVTQEKTALITSFNPEANARCRAYVLQAVNTKPGMTYTQIREWIMENKRFHMENVGARVRELARELKIPYVTIEYDEKHTVHVYPINPKGES